MRSRYFVDISGRAVLGGVHILQLRSLLRFIENEAN